MSFFSQVAGAVESIGSSASDVLGSLGGVVQTYEKQFGDNDEKKEKEGPKVAEDSAKKAFSNVIPWMVPVAVVTALVVLVATVVSNLVKSD